MLTHNQLRFPAVLLYISVGCSCVCSCSRAFSQHQSLYDSTLHCFHPQCLWEKENIKDHLIVWNYRKAKLQSVMPDYIKHLTVIVISSSQLKGVQLSIVYIWVFTLKNTIFKLTLHVLCFSLLLIIIRSQDLLRAMITESGSQFL